MVENGQQDEAAVAIGTPLRAPLLAKVVGNDVVVFIHATLHLLLSAACQNGDGCRCKERSDDVSRVLHGCV
jgi:hypothetical protein